MNWKGIKAPHSAWQAKPLSSKSVESSVHLRNDTATVYFSSILNFGEGILRFFSWRGGVGGFGVDVFCFL